MEYALRRRAIRRATALLCAAVATGALLAAAGPADGRDASRLLPEVTVEVGNDLLDSETGYVYRALARQRAAAELPDLTLDAELTAGAREAACAIARGDRPLAGEAAADDLAPRENVGLAIDSDPVASARTMHEWWASTPEYRQVRMDPAARRYGVGACADGDRTYYVERFAR